MAAALTLLLNGCLLQSVPCQRFQAFIPKNMLVLSGSCVTIPCSFDIEKRYERNLDKTCEAIWIHNGTRVFGSENSTFPLKGHFTGNLKNKDCTTTLNDMQSKYTSFSLRVECKNLKYNLPESLVFSVRDNPPKPTLSPSTLSVAEGSWVTLKCSAPAPCDSRPPALTWTPNLGRKQETTQLNSDKTKNRISTLTFRASHLHHKQNISCTATYSKEDGSTRASLSPSLTADISYSPKDTKVSVSPSGPVPEDSTVTLTCSSSANPAVKTYSWYRADGGQQASIGTGHVLNITASRDGGTFFCEARNVRGTGRSSMSHLDVHYAPQILPSFNCTKTADQLRCSCETVGKPTPTFQWYLDASPVNHSEKFAISTEPLNDTGVRSFITVNQPQERDFHALLCRSSNSQGSAAQRFYVYSCQPQTSAGILELAMFPAFIATVVALLALVCVLLSVIRAQRIRHRPPKCDITMSQLVTSEERNEVAEVTEEDIYANVSCGEDVANHPANSYPNNAISQTEPSATEGGSNSPEKDNVIYSHLKWKSKNNKLEAVATDRHRSSSHLEEEGCVLEAKVTKCSL